MQNSMKNADLAGCGLDSGKTALAALSGGADSTALLLFLADARDRGALGGLAACHVHHGIRGESADRDAAFCVELAGRLGVPLKTVHLDVPSLARARGESIETAARNARYAALERARVEFCADLIVTAHHRGDQAETVLMHLIRGAGLNGLTGMRRVRGNVARPFLDVTREEILSYLAERGQAYCTDETNALLNAERNRIRNEVLPLLKTLNPSVEAALSGMAERLGADEAYLSAAAKNAFSGLLCPEGGVNRYQTVQLDPAIRARVLQKLMIDAGVPDGTSRDAKRLTKLLTAQTGTEIELRNGFAAFVDARSLTVAKASDPKSFCVPLAAAGETVTPAGRFFAREAPTLNLPVLPNEAYFDFDRLPKELFVRTRLPGDRFRPLNAPGDKKLSDELTDRKIPRKKRDLPLIAGADRVYWAPGLPVTDLAKVRPSTKRILHIEFQEG